MQAPLHRVLVLEVAHVSVAVEVQELIPLILLTRPVHVLPAVLQLNRSVPLVFGGAHGRAKDAIPIRASVSLQQRRLLAPGNALALHAKQTRNLRPQLHVIAPGSVTGEAVVIAHHHALLPVLFVWR